MVAMPPEFHRGPQFRRRPGVRIEENYYSVDGQPKRFFDEEAVCRLFDGQWQRVSMTHQRTRKYVRSKALWEVVVERV